MSRIVFTKDIVENPRKLLEQLNIMLSSGIDNSRTVTQLNQKVTQITNVLTGATNVTVQSNSGAAVGTQPNLQFLDSTTPALTWSLTNDTGSSRVQIQPLLLTSPVLATAVVGTTRTLTVAGTTNRITSSAGAQDLSANRTWTLDIAATYVGQSSITTLGTITTGVWNGTTIAIANGGTGQVTANAALNALLPSQATNSGKYLTTNGTDASWATVTTGTVTSVSFTGGIISVATATTTPALTVAGTSGGIVYFSSASTWASTAPLSANQLVIGGGAGVAPQTLGSLGTTTTVLHGNAAGAPSFSAIVAADLPGGFNGFGNPTASVGLAVVNGSAVTAMRSDGAPALSQAIAPTWTALHIFATAARSSGVAHYHSIVTPADTGMTATTESIGIQFGGTNALTPLTVTRQWATGTIITQRENVFTAPTYAAVGVSTIQNSATVAITGAPIAGTNVTLGVAHAFWVQSGRSQFDGAIEGASTLIIGGTASFDGNVNMNDNTTIRVDLGTLTLTGYDNTTLYQDNSAHVQGIPHAATGSALISQGVTSAPIWGNTIQKDAIGATSTDGWILTNTTAAAAGAQQWSPRIRWTGRGWKTGGTPASRVVDYIAEVVPVEGSVVPTADWRLSAQINAGGYNNVFVINDGAQISVAEWRGTTVAVAFGGTGQTSYTNGQLLIGNTTGNTLTKATLTGTSNQITVTNGTGSITLSTPQDIHTSATPQFLRMGLGQAADGSIKLAMTEARTIAAPDSSPQVYIQNTTNSNQGHAALTLDKGATTAAACVNFRSAATTKWDMGLLDNNHFTIRDLAAVVKCVTFEAGTLANTIYTSANGVSFGSATVTSLVNIGSAAQTQFTTTGLLTKYLNVATTNNGVGFLVASSNLTAQGAAIAATTIYAVPAAGVGFYRVSWMATVTRAATTSCVLGGATGFQVVFTDQNDSVVKTMNPTTVTAFTSATNATGTTVSGVFCAYCKASTNLQYAFGYTSVGGTTMNYDISIRVEFIG